MTERQQQLLAEIKTAGSCFLSGADARVGQSLARLGHITLDDNGSMLGVNGRSDGERWWATFVRDPDVVTAVTVRAAARSAK